MVQQVLRHYILRLLILVAGLMVGLAPLHAQADPAPSTTDSPTAPVEFESLDSEVTAAWDTFQVRYRRFLDRQPMGFETELAETLWDDLRSSLARARGLPEALVDSSPMEFLQGSAFVWVLLIFLIGLRLVDRPALILAHRYHIGMLTTTTWMNKLWRAAACIGGRILPVLTFILLSFFPVRALFPGEAWPIVLTSFLVYLLAYRFVSSVVNTALAFGVVDVSDEDSLRIARHTRWTLLFVIPFLFLTRSAQIIGASNGLQAFLLFDLHIVLATVATSTLYLKPILVGLLPRKTMLQRRVHDAVNDHFRTFVLLAVILLGLRAAGYVYAATFILVRGYGVLMVVVAFIALAERARSEIDARSNQRALRDHRDLLMGFFRLGYVIALLVVIVVVLRVLGLYEPITTILRTDLLTIGETPISLYSLLASLVAFLCALLTGRTLRVGLVLRVFPKWGVELGVSYAFSALINYAAITVGFFLGLTQLGVSFSAITVLLASLGVGIGFGLQTMTENLISGFVLLFGRSVQKGDFVTVNNIYGQVDAVGARSVIVRTPDNFDILIPSKEMVGGQIINWSYRDHAVRVHVPLGVSYNSDPRHVEAILKKVAANFDPIMDQPAPEVWLNRFGDSAIEMALLVYFDCRVITKERLLGELNFFIWDALRAANVEIPFPQRDIHIRTDPGKPDVADVPEHTTDSLGRQDRK
jgi:small-conductance mechanosensitive channel